MGDLMANTLQVDQSIVTWEPLRKVTGLPPFTTPGRVRIGPDWTALAGNWFTQWERTGDEKWLERIKVGLVRHFPHLALSGQGVLIEVYMWAEGYCRVQVWDVLWECDCSGVGPCDGPSNGPRR